jgi:hypothetical protein
MFYRHLNDEKKQYLALNSGNVLFTRPSAYVWTIEQSGEQF